MGPREHGPSTFSPLHPRSFLVRFGNFCTDHNFAYFAYPFSSKSAILCPLKMNRDRESFDDMDKAGEPVENGQANHVHQPRVALDMSEIITPERIRCNSNVSSKKRVLEQLSELISAHHESVGQQSVFDCLVAREKLGSTGLGHGVAIPHGRLAEDADGALGTSAVGAFLKLKNPVDFDAPDQQKVDLVFGLLVPPDSTDEHLQILSRLAELFSQPDVRAALRAPKSPADVHLLLTTQSD